MVCTSSCSIKNKKESNEYNLKLVVHKSYVIDQNTVEMDIKLSNNLLNDTLVIPIDPWIRESWNSDGPSFSVFVDTSSKYPFIQLIDLPAHGQAIVYRSYPFFVFKKFVLILPKSDIMCKLKLKLRESYIKKINFELPVLVEIPFTDMKKFNKYRLEHQVLSEEEEVFINLVNPEYYPYSTNEKNEYKIKLDEVLHLQTGYSGNISILKE